MTLCALAVFDTPGGATIESRGVGVSIIVLAAGSSRRMGSPKPLLAFDGETCLSLVLRACLGSRADESVLVLGADAAMIKVELDQVVARARREGPLGPKVLVHEQHERGQTSSLKAGLEAMSGRTDAFVVLPVDHALVTSLEIDSLIARFEERPRGRTIFIAAHQGRRGHPVLFAASHRSPVLELADDEPLSDYVRLREGGVEKVEMDSPWVTAGMNTPEEYQILLAAYRARVAP